MVLARGAPGHPPTWTSAAKDAVVSALGSARVWATVGRGVINEVYWPTTGTPQVREWTFMVRVGERWVDVAAAGRYTLDYLQPEAPLPVAVHTGDGYELALTVIPDPLRDAVAVRYELRQGDEVAFQLNPSLSGSASDNRAWVDEGVLYALGHHQALAIVADVPFARASVGYVGTSDALGAIAGGHAPEWLADRTEVGVVALWASMSARSGAIALAFAEEADGARVLAESFVAEGAEAVAARAEDDWTTWANCVLWAGQGVSELDDLARRSLTVLKVHEDVSYPGAIVASLSLPWGTTHEDAGGYHLVWPRDAVQSALALVAAGQIDDARRVLAYLIAMQSSDGHWVQNFFPSGRGYWSGLQLDETALPVLLAAALHENGAPDLPGTEAMVRGAVAFLCANGPTSPQDRWEENHGANPFTLATMIAALTAAAPWLEGEQALDAQDVADEWNERIESWTYVVDTPLARRCGVPGYYVRLSAPVADTTLCASVQVRNRDGVSVPASALVCMDFLALARYGLRDPSDERMVATVAVVDEILGVHTPSGVVYRRYNEDGYGEHDDGRAYDGTGVGRPWPLLVGERGHWALQRGEDVTPYLMTMAACAGRGGLLPEQVWDAAPIPDLGLYPGRPSGSAMPLAWAHAEYLRLYLAARRGRPFELLDSVAQRYGARMPAAVAWRWRTETPVDDLPAGRELHVECATPFVLHFGWDGWHDVDEREARPHLEGRWRVCFTVDELDAHTSLEFTRRYPDGWEGVDHHVRLQHPSGDCHLCDVTHHHA